MIAALVYFIAGIAAILGASMLPEPMNVMGGGLGGLLIYAGTETLRERRRVINFMKGLKLADAMRREHWREVYHHEGEKARDRGDAP